jgi:hypothetical protein
MISRMVGTPVFSDRTEFSVITDVLSKKDPSYFALVTCGQLLMDGDPNNKEAHKYFADAYAKIRKLNHLAEVTELRSRILLRIVVGMSARYSLASRTPGRLTSTRRLPNQSDCPNAMLKPAQRCFHPSANVTKIPERSKLRYLLFGKQRMATRVRGFCLIVDIS